MIAPHTVPWEIFTSLAMGGGGRAGVGLLARAQRSKHLLLLRHVVAVAEELGHERAPDLAAAYDLLARLHADRPSAVEPVLRHPPLATWALRMPRALRAGRGAPSGFGYLPALAASAAIRTGAECTVDLLVPAGRVTLPTLGQARLPAADRRRASRARVHCGPAGAEIIAAGSRVPLPTEPSGHADYWTGLRRIDARSGDRDFELLVDDLDPYRLPHVLRDAVTAARQSRREIGRWRDILQKSWELLTTHHPAVAEELPEAITVLVPARSHRGGWLSATARHAFGQVTLSPPPDARALACAFAHELQHAKLSALLDLVPLLKPAGYTRWYAPWREDPRPLPGLLQGAYAHLAVAAFWRIQRFVDQGEESMRGHAEYARWRRDTCEVVATLRASGALTEAGLELVDRMSATLDSWGADAVPASALRRARAESDRHRSSWLERNRTS